ncbi:MAG TPA: hypothetical protein VG370_15090 [Chloroflexota bacterium]|jgi:hypothetical protein|nr:hypothetical protein [Chloroflexota bacterium]
MQPSVEPHAESLLGDLGRVPDRRRRQGRRYPLAAVLGMLVLAAPHGESSLRGMWLWARARWALTTRTSSPLPAAASTLKTGFQ